MAADLASAILASAQRLGVNPLDLGTAISYETAGTFDPWKAGPTTKWGQHRGLIQWGEPQRAKYGVFQGQPVDAQMQAAERYLTDAGVRPGMGLLDIYSAINAGHVGRHGASDAAAGGAPGTVADKVKYQMADHRRNAQRLLGDVVAGVQGSAVPASIGPAAPTPIPATGPAPGSPFAPPASPSSVLAALFLQNQQAAQQRKQDERAAEEARRAALFAGADPFSA